MAIIYSTDLKKELIDGAKIQTSSDSVPNQLAEKVVPVMEVNPKLLKKVDWVAHLTATTTQSAVAIFTAPTGYKTFLKGLTLSVQSDAAADNTTTFVLSRLVSRIGGGTGGSVLARINKLTTTASQGEKTLYFDGMGLELMQGQNTTITNAFTAGASVVSVTLWGYVEENSTA